MPRTNIKGRSKPSLDEQFAMAERVLRGINKSIDDEIDRARDLEVEHARALYRSGKATLHDANDVIDQARQRIK